jgi:hypothetical protein
MVADHREAVAGEGAAKRPCEGVGILGVQPERDRRDGVAGDGSGQGAPPSATF